MSSTSNNFIGPHQNQPILTLGASLEDATSAMIMIHGRGATAEDILSISNALEPNENFIYLAPQAQNYTWYPYSFLENPERNQPGLKSGLQVISNLIAHLESNGINKERIYILGFSQGACLATEFMATSSGKFGGLIALSGGLIGNVIDPNSYNGDLSNTPVFLGCSDIDPHIPLKRVNETEQILLNLNAQVIKKIYPGMGHLVNDDEIQEIRKLIAAS